MIPCRWAEREGCVYRRLRCLPDRLHESPPQRLPIASPVGWASGLGRHGQKRGHFSTGQCILSRRQRLLSISTVALSG